MCFETKSLYMYHSCPKDECKKRKRVRDILVDHQLYFASPKCFNDPFDCVVPKLLQISGTTLKRFVESFVERRCPNATEARTDEMMSRAMSPRVLKDIRNDLQNDIDNAGVVCFSEVRDDILMWSHYADKHRGLCLEFDGSPHCKFFGEAQRVEYADYTSMPLGDPDREMKRVILTKAKHWCYEREYRIIKPNKANTKLDYPADLLTGVIFGCQMPSDIRRSVKRWTEKGNCRVAFFEACPKEAEFGLDIVLIDPEGHIDMT